LMALLGVVNLLYFLHCSIRYRGNKNNAYSWQAPCLVYDNINHDNKSENTFVGLGPTVVSRAPWWWNGTSGFQWGPGVFLYLRLWQKLNYQHHVQIPWEALLVPITYCKLFTLLPSSLKTCHACVCIIGAVVSISILLGELE
jgi:hypothetical protein